MSKLLYNKMIITFITAKNTKYNWKIKINFLIITQNNKCFVFPNITREQNVSIFQSYKYVFYSPRC